jgi:hypothetical protein
MEVVTLGRMTRGVQRFEAHGPCPAPFGEGRHQATRARRTALTKERRGLELFVMSIAGTAPRSRVLVCQGPSYYARPGTYYGP